jgi:glycosyltransferase involved in cell wall biosynthesis
LGKRGRFAKVSIGYGWKVSDTNMNDLANIGSPEYSVVVPVYNSEASLGELCQRISKVFSEIEESYEIILVDDSSADNSWQIMKGLKKNDKNIKIIQLMRNFGQHNAILCGFYHVTGKYVITMDDDLQNPPEEMPKLINKIMEGYDAVIGAPEVKQDKFYKNIGSFFIRYLNTKIFNKPKSLKLSSFRIMTRAVTYEIKVLKTPYPYISGMLLSLTRNLTNVTVGHDERKYGSSTYNLTKLIKLAFNLIINYSSLPLKFLTYTGIVVSAISFCLGLYFIVKKFLVGIPVPGWTSVVVLLSFFNGLLLVILSIMGEYLSRIINEVSNRQQFVIRDKYL